jgi:hypothetical protein
VVQIYAPMVHSYWTRYFIKERFLVEVLKVEYNAIVIQDHTLGASVCKASYCQQVAIKT